jgi:hypothetical protein
VEASGVIANGYLRMDPGEVPAPAAMWSSLRLGGCRSPVGDPRQHKKSDP